MICEVCGKKEASLTFTKIVNGVSEVHHYCDECIQKLYEDKMFGLSQHLLKMTLDSLAGKQDNPVKAEQPALPKTVCPKCKKTFAQFVKDKQFKCDSCYNAFEEAFRQMLGSEAPAAQKKISIEDLEKKLKEAVSREDYQRAAVLRDRIASMKERKGSDKE